MQEKEGSKRGREEVPFISLELACDRSENAILNILKQSINIENDLTFQSKFLAHLKE